jgi:hypothetical protein
MADIDSKACRVCGVAKRFDEYHAKPSNKDGRSSVCKSCHNTSSNERYHRTKALHPQVPERKCAHCGAQFLAPITSPPTNTKHCSDECRFWSKVDKSGGDESCWEFIGAKANFGYGSFRFLGKADRGHRVAWQLKEGAIPNGLFVCHSCDNPPCCNPAHLFLGTARDNVADMRAKGRSVISPEGRERISASKRGRPIPPHVRAAQKLALTGRKQPQSQKDKRAASLRGRKRSAAEVESLKAAWVMRRARGDVPFQKKNPA